MACKPLPKRAKRTPFSPSYRREELCFCTEELGSESISCRSVMETANTVMQPQGHHGRLQTCGYHDRNVLSADGRCTLQSVGLRCKANKPLQLTDMPACEAGSRSAAREVSTHFRTFPPPIPSLLNERPIMRSFKSEGRFLLQRVNTTSSSPFRSVRENGRLRLLLVSSSSSLDCCNGEGQHSSLQKANYADQAEEDDGESKTASDVQDQGLHNVGKEQSQEDTQISYRPSLCMPRSMLFGSSCGWDTARGAPCRYLPTLRLLLEKAQRFNCNGQTGNGSLITARECKDVKGAHCHLQDKALHKLKSNAPLITSSGLQLLGNGNQFSSTLKPCSPASTSTQLENLQQYESNAICRAPVNAEAKKEDGYAILSLGFNDLVLLVVLEGTKALSMTIKGDDSCHYSNASAASTGSRVEYGPNTDKQPCSAGSKGLSYDTWHPSKPIDFRIAA